MNVLEINYGKKTFISAQRREKMLVNVEMITFECSRQLLPDTRRAGAENK